MSIANMSGADVSEAELLVEERRVVLARADVRELDAVRQATYGLSDRLVRLSTRHHVTPAIMLLDRVAFDLVLQRNKLKLTLLRPHRGTEGRKQ